MTIGEFFSHFFSSTKDTIEVDPKEKPISKYISRLVGQALTKNVTAIRFSVSDRKQQRHLEESLKPDYFDKQSFVPGSVLFDEKLGEITK